jgi:hypothetical protein
MTCHPLTMLKEASSEGELQKLGDFIAKNGYPLLKQLLDALNDEIKRFTDGDAHELTEWIARAKRAVPEPGSISPFWDKIWGELESMVMHKRNALTKINPDQRAGEWQIIIDNPYSQQEVVCYPGLSFDKAAYLYGYFRSGLEKNEYIRLQKVVSLLIETGTQRIKRSHLSL